MLHRSSQRGFSLLEMIFSISLMALLVSGVMDLYLASARTTARTQAQVYATNDAANSIQTVIGQLREAQSFALPTGVSTTSPESTWLTLSNVGLSSFSTIYNSETIDTAIQIATAPVLTPAANGYTQAGVTQIQVQNASGTISIPSQPYESSGGPPAKTVLIYRGDPDGTPDSNPTGSAVANAGTYLWQYTIPANQTFALDLAHNNPVAICKSVSTAANAVQFVRPSYSNVPEPWQVELKIISGYYSPINGTETIEGGSGISQLSGKCVYMRDHSATGVPSGAGTLSSNNTFQHN